MRYWASIVTGQMGYLLSEVVMYDSQIDYALQGIEKTAKQARTELYRFSRCSEQLKAQLEQARIRGLRWEQRARKLRDGGRKVSVEFAHCRRQQLGSEERTLELQVWEHARLQIQLVTELQSILERIEAIRLRRETGWRDRQVRTGRLRSMPLKDLVQVKESIERWNRKVVSIRRPAKPRSF